jgi:hypothetical protein
MFVLFTWYDQFWNVFKTESIVLIEITNQGIPCFCADRILYICAARRQTSIQNATWSGHLIGLLRNRGQSIQQEVVGDSFQMDDILGEDIVYESHSSDESGSDFEEDVDW